MTKGKDKKKRKFISIMLVPHYPSRIKTINVSSLYGKISTLLLLLTIIAACVGLYIKNAVEENHKLKEDITALYELNFEQKDLLFQQNDIIDNKNRSIESLQSEIDERDQFIGTKIDEVLNKYKEITNQYILGRIDTNLASRSGTDRSQTTTFANDVKSLREMLKDLNTLYKDDTNEVFDLSESTEKLENYLACIPTSWPAEGEITSHYGYRIHPITRTRKFHYGLDIGVKYGQTVYASGDGVVTVSKYNGGYGYCIEIDHGHGLVSLYGHNSKLLVKKGTHVKRGDPIAKAGNTGVSTGVHCHFEIKINGNAVDPLEFLEEKP